MNLRQIDTKIDFADSYFISSEIHDKKLTVYLKSWEEKVIRIVFYETMQFTYNLGSFAQGVFEVMKETPFLLEALSMYYEKIPKDQPYKMFVINDIDDFIFFEVVAQNVSISIEP